MQYIGSRYVPKFMGTYDATQAYEVLCVVDNGLGTSYISRVPTPAGTPLTDTNYWAVYGASSGAIINLQNQINELRGRIYDIRDYGMESGDNIYDALFDLLWTVHTAGGGIVYFPKGTYTLDYTILIPDNTTLIGDGDATKIIFDNSDTYLGCALANGGSNVCIMNMDVEQASNSQYLTNVALPNTIGIGDGDFAGYTTKRDHSIYRKAGNTNIKIINVNSHNCNYGIQIEPGAYEVSDIFIENHICESGMFSIQPLTNTTIIKNVFVNNVVCDTFRNGNGYTGQENVNVDGLFCTQILLKSNNINIENFHLHSAPGNRDAASVNSDTAIYATGDNQKFVNGYITKSADSAQNRLVSGANAAFTRNIFFANVNVAEGVTFSGAYANPDYTNIYTNNCNFDPYYGYETITNATEWASSTCPNRIKFSPEVGRSVLSGWFGYTFGSGANETIGTINAAILNTGIPKKGSAPCVLLDTSAHSQPPEMAILKITTAGEIAIVRPNNTGYAYTSFFVDLVF